MRDSCGGHFCQHGSADNENQRSRTGQYDVARLGTRSAFLFRKGIQGKKIVGAKELKGGIDDYRVGRLFEVL